MPTLIVTGDEDDPCIEPSIYLKKNIPASGLAVFPKSGHTVNIEEPALFNQTLGDFLALVDAAAGESAIRARSGRRRSSGARSAGQEAFAAGVAR